MGGLVRCQNLHPCVDVLGFVDADRLLRRARSGRWSESRPRGKPEEAAALTRVRQALETDRYAALKAADQLVIATERQKGAGTKLSYIFPSEVWLPFTARRGGMLLRSSPGCRSPVCCLGERSFSDRPLA